MFEYALETKKKHLKWKFNPNSAPKAKFPILHQHFPDHEEFKGLERNKDLNL